MKPKLTRCLVAFASVMAFTTSALGQEYPNRPVKIFVGYVAGGGPDVIARLLGQKLSQTFGQQFIIENKPGAGATLATAVVAKSPGDGYTLLIGETGQLEIAPNLYKALPYDPIKDLTAIGLVASTPQVLITNAKTGNTTIRGLIREAKASPGKLNYGSSGIGSLHHIAMEVFKAGAELDITHVAYKGAPQALPALLSGEVDVMLTSLVVAGPHVRAGTINILAVTSARRFDVIPEIPSISEVIAGYDHTSEIGVLGPANMPSDVVMALSKAIKTALDSAEIQSKFKEMGLMVTWTTPEAYADKIRQNMNKYERAVRVANIQPN
jgi:tripartite-type tricarboxylate transporter receptor subunit TctC